MGESDIVEKDREERGTGREGREAFKFVATKKRVVFCFVVYVCVDALAREIHGLLQPDANSGLGKGLWKGPLPAPPLEVDLQLLQSTTLGEHRLVVRGRLGVPGGVVAVEVHEDVLTEATETIDLIQLLPRGEDLLELLIFLELEALASPVAPPGRLERRDGVVGVHAVSQREGAADGTDAGSGERWDDRCHGC